MKKNIVVVACIAVSTAIIGVACGGAPAAPAMPDSPAGSMSAPAAPAAPAASK